MKLFGNRKGAEHIAARKTEKKTSGLKRWQRPLWTNRVAKKASAIRCRHSQSGQ